MFHMLKFESVETIICSQSNYRKLWTWSQASSRAGLGWRPLVSREILTVSYRRTTAEKEKEAEKTTNKAAKTARLSLVAIEVYHKIYYSSYYYMIRASYLAPIMF